MPDKKKNAPIQEDKTVKRPPDNSSDDRSKNGESADKKYSRDVEIEENEVDVDIDEFAERMELTVLHRGKNKRIRFNTFNVSRPGLQLAGYYKHFSAERVQVLGEMESAYLRQMTHQARKTACETLMKHPIPCLILTSVMPPCDELIAAAEKFDRVLMSSKQRTTMFVNKLSLYLNELLAPSVTVHAVLMDIYGVGVLVMGESGIGKSETALSLIERGHRLVADDAVTITRVGERLEGVCPEVIRYFMELRGVGLIDVKAMYGAGAVQESTEIDIVVRLEEWSDKTEYNRLGVPRDEYTVLGIKRPLYVIPVKPGRNLAIILEAAARTHRLSVLGFSAAEELNERLKGKFKKC